MNGIFVIDKPQNMTSHDVVSIMRRKIGVRRVGHSGTLDPMATGVLPIFVGKATRVIEYASRTDDQEAKLYRCTMKLGIETDTQDIWGDVIGGAPDAAPDETEITRALKGFEGAGTQLPPMYSAVRVEGKRLYEYARQGKAPDAEKIRLRFVYIKHITVINMDLSKKEVVFDVLCSKGVYIRTLCADVGKILGCGAVMSGLIRLKSDGFSIDNAISVDALQGADAETLTPLPEDTPLLWLPRTELDAASARRFVQGQDAVLVGDIDLPPEAYGSDGAKTVILRVYGSVGFLGVGELRKNGVVRPKKVLV